MKMTKKFTRVLGSLVLMLALVAGIVATAAPEAKATTKTYKVSLIAGEQTSLTVWGSTVKKVTTSKSSVVTAKKSDSTHVTCTAKKAGKATVTIVGANGGVLKYIFTVKAFKLAFSFESVRYTEGTSSVTSDIAMLVVNNTGLYISSATTNVVLYDMNGEILEKKEYTFYDLVPGAKIYKMISYTGAPVGNAGVDGKAKTSRSITTKYTNMTKKVVTTTELGESSMQVKVRNKTKKSVYGSADVVFYDENGYIVYVRPCAFSLSSKGVDTTDITYIPTGAVDYKVFTRAYAKA